MIQDSNSPWASPILLVKKKDGDLRMCIDYHKLNKQTVPDKYPLPRIDDLLDQLKGTKYFTTLDMASGYHHIAIASELRPVTAFVTPEHHCKWLRMPFGVMNGPAVFQRAVHQGLRNVLGNVALTYLDDVLIAAAEIDEALVKLEKTLKELREAGLMLKLSKCKFLATTLDYLGHELSSQGIRPAQTKISAVKQFPVPKDVHQI